MSDVQPGRYRIDDVSFEDILHLEPHGADTYVGIAPRYPWGRLFGGQVIAQGLRAAQLTIPEDYFIHSLHAYFIRGGTHREPVRLEVDRIRNGRSFCTRRVVARQSNGAILNLSASFHVEEEAPDVPSLRFPADVVPPDSLPDQGWGNMVARREVDMGDGRTLSWIRLLLDEPLADRNLEACGLAFISDTVMTGAARTVHPRWKADDMTRADAHDVFMGASLDHAMFFQRRVDPSGWILAEVESHGLVGARGLTTGKLFNADGLHVSSTVQEVLLRERKVAV